MRFLYPILCYSLLLSNNLLAQITTQKYVDFWDEDQTIKKSEGIYEFGFEEGLWSYWYKNGQLEEKTYFKLGKFDGSHTQWYTNGQKKRMGFFKQNYPDSLYTEWHSNGALKLEGAFIKGKKKGLWKSSFDTKTPHYLMRYKDSTKVILYCYNKKGAKILERGSGLFIDYTELGEISEKTFYKEHTKNGLCTKYYNDGVVI